MACTLCGSAAHNARKCSWRDKPGEVPAIEKQLHHGGAVPARLMRFFMDNPGEELTHDDIKAKFSCSNSAARHAVSSLERAQKVEAVRVIRLRIG